MRTNKVVLFLIEPNRFYLHAVQLIDFTQPLLTNKINFIDFKQKAIGPNETNIEILTRQAKSGYNRKSLETPFHATISLIQ